MKKIILILLIFLTPFIIREIFLNAGQSDKELINSPELDSKTNEQMQNLFKLAYYYSAYNVAKMNKFRQKLQNREITVAEFNEATKDLSIKTTKDYYDNLGIFREIKLSKHANFMVSSAVRQDDIKELPDEICMLKNLEEIDVEGTGITDLPPCVINLTKLERLNFGKTYIKEIPETISKIPNLKRLSLRTSKLERLGNHISNLKNLEKLDISQTAISEIPPQIENLVSLKEIYCYNCDNLNSLPKELANLQNLEVLFLMNLTIKEFPDELLNSKSLKSLVISFENFPQNFANLQGLEILDIGKINMENLSEILKLKNLRILDIAGNITAIPDEIGNLDKLEEFYYRHGGLETISPKIANLKNLKELWIYGNKKLSQLPENLGDLENLESLQISDTNITKLPQSMVNLKNLDELWISNTGINELPSGFGNLENLRELGINNTKITEFPNGFENLGKLEQLYFKNTPIKNQEILSKMPNLRIIEK